MNRHFVFILCAVFTITLFSGCQVLRRSNELDTSDMSDKAKAGVLIQEKIIEKVYETNWLVTAFIVAGVIGIVSAWRGCKDGWLVVVGSVIGWLWVRMDQALMANKWLLLIPAAMIIFALGRFVYRDFIGKVTFKRQLAGSGQSKAGEKLIHKYERKIR